MTTGAILLASPLPEFHQQVRDQFYAALIAGGTKSRTAEEYARQVKMFLAWAVQSGYAELGTLPQDALERYYAYRSFGPNNTARNLPRAAVHALLEWVPRAGVPLPAIDLPPSVSIPKRVHVTTVPAPTYPSASEVLAAAQPTPQPPSVQGPPAGAPPSASSGPPPVPSPSPSPPQAPQAFPAPTYPVPSTVRPMAPPRLTDTRRPRNSMIAALMPEGGYVEILRVSDGSDGNPPGTRIPIGIYRERDLRGYSKIENFVREAVHPQQPSHRGPTMTYIVEQYNGAGALVPPIHQFPLPTSGSGLADGPTGPSAGWLGDFTGTPGLPRSGNPAVDAVVKTFVGRIERMEALALEDRKRMTETLDRVQKKAVEGGDMQALMMTLMMERSRQPETASIRDTMNEFAQRLAGVGGGGLGGQPITMAPVPVPGSDATVVLGDLLKTTMTARPAAPPPAPPDPFDMMTKAKNLFAPPAAPADPQMALMHETVKRLSDQNTALLTKLDQSKAVTWVDKMEELDKFDTMLQRRIAGNVGAVEVVGALVEKLPEVVKAVGDLVQQWKAGKLPALTAGSPNAPVGAQPAGPTKIQVPEAIAKAVDVFAESRTEQEVLNNLRGLIIAMAQAGAPFTKLLEEFRTLLAEDVDTWDELTGVVVTLLKITGGKTWLTKYPNLARDFAEVIARNFPAVCQSLSIPPRALLGLPAREAPAAPTAREAPAAETPTAPTVVAPPVAAKEEREEEEGKEPTEEMSDGEKAKVPA